jgi:hypothetical protein
VVNQASSPLAQAHLSRRRLTAEIWIVLGLSLGQSAVYATVSLVAKLTAGPALRDQTATLNASKSTREYLDLTYQVLTIGFALVPVALALFLLSGSGRSATRAIGLDFARPWRDLAIGAGLAAVVGLPGIGIYAIGRELNLTATIVPSALDQYWWTVPILLLSALKNAIIEEVVAVGFLVTKLRQLRWRAPAIIAASSALRGSYHLYQGYGMAFGNALMGALFSWLFYRTGRVMPLVIAHTILDVISFVGYALFKDVFGLP